MRQRLDPLRLQHVAGFLAIANHPLKRRYVRGFRDLRRLHSLQHLLQRRAFHRRSQRENRVQNPAQRKKVRALVQFINPPLRLLRRHVLRRAHDGALEGLLRQGDIQTIRQ